MLNGLNVESINIRFFNVKFLVISIQDNLINNIVYREWNILFQRFQPLFLTVGILIRQIFSSRYNESKGRVYLKTIKGDYQVYLNTYILLTK